MSQSANGEGTSTEPEKPVQSASTTAALTFDVQFPPYPEPTDADFDDDINEEEKNYYKSKFPDLNAVKNYKLHCSACDRHLGCSARNESRMRAHPMLRTLVCHTCHTFYNSGEFDKGDDGSELYCRWCGQGGQVYCCADCPHVFCAKCIKRNLGPPKIKEIEDADDWKCFKCSPKCLWDLRALCWALLRYCDLKNKITYSTEDQDLKEKYQKDCAIDHSECCKRKTKRKSDIKKEQTSSDIKKSTAAAISKIPSTIQVKKFASISNTEENKLDKKPQKRPASPKIKPIFLKAPIPVSSSNTKLIANPVALTPIPSLPKKARMPNIISPMIRFKVREPSNTYGRIRPKLSPVQINFLNNQYNGYNNQKSFNNTSTYNNMVANDTINLSLESLTQGLDMSAVVAMASNNGSQDDDVVCTPDFPLEPLCEVTEDNTDDDVQCITPGPVVPPKIRTPPPLVPRTLPEISNDNIIQMTENDVTVNAATGGLKFRVDPQTLSSNKMYRLPDGRIFAINTNPNMPGGYSATIVAVAEANNTNVKNTPKGPTYAAKLSAVTCTNSANKSTRTISRSNTKRNIPRTTRVTRGTDTSSRECDLNVSIEWYRYNLIDAVDALEYSLSRLHKLKKETTSMFLRTRSIAEMKNLHKTLDRLLNTSSTRFNEIRDNLNKELKQYLLKKSGDAVSEDDDDVEILNDVYENDDPIFIDENSEDSNLNETNGSENQEVDLTVASSEHNDSAENNVDDSKMEVDPPEVSQKESDENTTHVIEDFTSKDGYISIDKTIAEEENSTDDKECSEPNNDTAEDQNAQALDHLKCDEVVEKNESELENDDVVKECKNNAEADEISKDAAVKEKEIFEKEVKKETFEKETFEKEAEKEVLDEQTDDIKDEKGEDEISDEMIETLLNDDSNAGKEESIPST